MDRLTQEVRQALESGLWVVALQGTLALIDICAALDSEDGRTRRTRFEAWFSKYLGTKYPWFSAADAYQLRCGLLHQGRSSSGRYGSIAFNLPGGVRVHNNIMDDIYVLDLNEFCDDVIGTVERWWHISKDSEPARSNSEHVVRVRPDGMPPSISGVPLLG